MTETVNPPATKLVILTVPSNMSLEQLRKFRKTAKRRFGPGFRVVVLASVVTYEILDCPDKKAN
jgi:hypothetical protein